MEGGNGLTVAELIAYAIAGHHAGLPDRIGPVGSLDQRVAAFNAATLDPAWLTEIKPDVAGLLPGFDFGNRTTIAFRLAFLGRMIFSCLVDADYRDTERFYREVTGYIPDREWRQLTDILPEMIAAFDRHMGAFAADERPVNRLRREILDHVRSRATESRGLFTLTVPTGGGKTLTSLGFALDHARHHGHSRIIYAIPFTGARIETPAGCHRQGAGAVASRAGARIETVSQSFWRCSFGAQPYIRERFMRMWAHASSADRACIWGRA